MKKYRLKQKAYICEEQNEDGNGSTKDVTHSFGGAYLLWSGECEIKPDTKFFADVGIKMPANDNEARGGDPNDCGIGDAEYSYELEVLVGEKWKYAGLILRA